MPDFAVILPAAGSSTRYGAGRSKLLEDLGGQSVLARSLIAFLQRPDVVLVVIATQAELPLPEDKRIRRCPGGNCRARSVQNALELVPPQIEWVAVHDAARPLISQELIDRTLAEACVHGAAAPAMPVELTVRQAQGPLPAMARGLVPRHELWTMQTPQVARRADLLAGFAACPVPLEQITDDLQLLELSGRSVRLVPGEARNLKITTPPDLALARWMLRTGV